MKTFRFLFVLVSPLLVACASTATSPQANQSQLAANSFQPPAGKAGLYLFEEGSLIRTDYAHRVFLDGNALGLLTSSSFLYATLTPGPHVIRCETSEVTVHAVAGQNIFVRQKVLLDKGGQIVGSNVAEETPKIAIPLIKEMQTME